MILIALKSIPMDLKIIEQNKIKLETEKQRLEKMLASFAHKEKTSNKEEYTTDYPNISDDMDDNAIEVEMYAASLGEEKSLEGRLQKVNSALERIAAGNYGRCSVGGEEIEAARLSVAPEADTCVKHAR